MTVFLSLFFNLLPLYVLIALGFFAGRRLNVDRHSIGNLAIYLCMPVVVFGYIANLDFRAEYIIMPVVIYIASAVTGLTFLQVGKKIYHDNQANLMSLCVSMGNTGYFGLPLVLLFFDKEIVAIYVFMMVGSLMYESTVGYYIAARGQFDVRQSFIKLAKLPTVYAMAAGFTVNAMNVQLPEMFWEYWTHFKGAYVILGMMIIGVALSGIKKFEFGPRFIALVFTGKFGLYVLIAVAFIALDKNFLYLLNGDLHKIIIFMAICPPAANIAAFAAQLDLQPEKAATTILLGTIFALLYIPTIIWFFDL